MDKWRDQLGKVMLRIPAENIVSKRYGIDQTFSRCEITANMGEVEGLRAPTVHNSTFHRPRPSSLSMPFRHAYFPK